jgi:N-acetylglutamate synthase
LAPYWTGGWWAREGGLIAGASTVPFPTMNGVWAYEKDADPGVADRHLARLEQEGLPHCLQIRPGADRRFAEVARERGMSGLHEIPLMVVTDADLLDADRDRGLEVRRLDPHELQLHVSTGAAGFGIPEERFATLMPQSYLGSPGVTAYVGVQDGKPVCTALAAMSADAVGIFNVGTPPAFRRQGYGAAVTRRAVLDGFNAGAGWAWLQASPAGFPVYERLGFRTAERWQVWTR